MSEYAAASGASNVDRLYGLMPLSGDVGVSPASSPDSSQPWDVYERYFQALEIGIPEFIEEAKYDLIRSLDYDSQVDVIEELMKRYQQVEIPVEHKFPNGLYKRTVIVPAGTLMTSKIHKKDHICVLLKGSISVASNEHETMLFEAPFVFASKAGSRRVGLTHEETIWMTVHDAEGVDDVATIEEMLFEVRTPNPIVKQLLGGTE